MVWQRQEKCSLSEAGEPISGQVMAKSQAWLSVSTAVCLEILVFTQARRKAKHQSRTYQAHPACCPPLVTPLAPVPLPLLLFPPAGRPAYVPVCLRACVPAPRNTIDRRCVGPALDELIRWSGG